MSNAPHLVKSSSSSIGKFGLRVGAAAVLALIVVNSVFALRHLERIRQSEAQVQDAAVLQAKVTAVLLDLSEIEAGQRGYILTNDPDYLEPYEAAKTRLGTDFASLRTGLATGTQKEKELEAGLETVAQSKIAEAERSIYLRRRQFRKRAFDMIDTNEGKGYMDLARASVGELSAATANALAGHEQETKRNIQQARTTAILANLGLLALTGLVFVAFHFYTQRLERAVEERTAALRSVNVRLEGFTSTISQRVRELLGGLQQSASALLHGYGDYLPRQAQEYAQHIQGAAGETNQLLEELVVESKYEEVA